MDRGRRAEPYSNATIWTREVARNMAGHLSRVSKAHSCVDTKSPTSTRLPKFQHAQKRCPTSPMKTRQPLMAISRNSSATGEHELDYRGIGGGSAREEAEGASGSLNNQRNTGDRNHDFVTANAVCAPLEVQNNSTNRAVEANQDIQDRSVRVPAVKTLSKQYQVGISSGTRGDMVYNCPPVLPHQKNRSAHDYYKRQEQQKIWQENQALIKRLQSTKATLNAKEWKKDGKWTQEFLKTQEKRRSALRQELHRVQVSPHALLRSKPLKSLHPKTILDVAEALGAPQPTRHKLKGQVLSESRELSRGTTLPASAANHRRITKLRSQNPSPCSSGDLVDVCSTEKAKIDATDTATENNQAAFIPDNGIVNVRFTFSRGRSRGSCLRTTEVEQYDQPPSSEVDESERDQMSLSGAFSPGVELESALNAVAVGQTGFTNQSSRGQFPEAVSSTTVDKIAVEANTTMQNELKLHNGIQENVPDGTTAVENEPENGFVYCTEERGSPRQTEEEPAQPDSEDEEAYDEDNFDDDPAMPDMDNHDAPPEQKGEASGYWSEFEEETAVPAIPHTPTLIDNQDQNEDDEEDASYSNDDFVE